MPNKHTTALVTEHEIPSQEMWTLTKQRALQTLTTKPGCLNQGPLSQHTLSMQFLPQGMPLTGIWMIWTFFLLWSLVLVWDLTWLSSWNGNENMNHNWRSPSILRRNTGTRYKKNLHCPWVLVAGLDSCRVLGTVDYPIKKADFSSHHCWPNSGLQSWTKAVAWHLPIFVATTHSLPSPLRPVLSFPWAQWAWLSLQTETTLSRGGRNEGFLLTQLTKYYGMRVSTFCPKLYVVPNSYRQVKLQ